MAPGSTRSIEARFAPKHPPGPAVRTGWWLASTAIVALALSDGMVMADGNGHPRDWYVSATATAGGDGSKKAPFSSLALVQQASGPGDTIVVLASPVSVAPLASA